MSKTAEIIRQRRTELGWSQAELAERVGVDPRQMRRYESGESQPTLGVARNLAAALGITIDELAGSAPTYAGRWFTCWQGADDRPPFAGWAELTHRGSGVEVGHPREKGAVGDSEPLAWRAGLHADDDALLGWYALDAPTRSRGTLMLRRHGETIRGTWISMSLKSGLDTGSLGMGRTCEDAERALREMLAEAAAKRGGR